MGAPKRPEGGELLRRMAAWGDEWRAVAACTERADRSRAEAAIGSLYRSAGQPEPAFAWVPSPAAGIMAYALASTARAQILSPYARGDIGNGANQHFNALALPFGMEPAWTLRLAATTRDALPPERVPQGLAIRPVGAVAGALGLDGTARTMTLVRAVAAAESLHPRLAGGTAAGAAAGAPGPAQRTLAGEPAFDGAAVDLAAGVLGDAWPRLVELVGRDLAGSLFAEATRRLAAAVLTDHHRRRDALQAMQPGQWDAFTPALAAARDVVGGRLWRLRAGRAEREAQVDARLEVARSAGPWWALEGLAIVSERPLVLRRDDRGRPHCADGPAIAWPDGLAAHAWHGVAVEPWVVTDPGRITVQAVDAERNVEVRRVLVERFGEERLVREGGADLVSEDETGRLWLRRMGEPRMWGLTDEPIVMVEVRNATPEPDGSRRTYYLRVPPTMRTAREAVAWTFGLGALEYRPAAES